MRGDVGTYHPKAFEIAGFDLFGERQSDGSIKLGAKPRLGPDDRTHLSAFPEKVRVQGATYELEFVKENLDGQGNRLPPDHPGHNICWGVYV